MWHSKLIPQLYHLVIKQLHNIDENFFNKIALRNKTICITLRQMSKSNCAIRYIFKKSLHSNQGLIHQFHSLIHLLTILRNSFRTYSNQSMLPSSSSETIFRMFSSDSYLQLSENIFNVKFLPCSQQIFAFSTGAPTFPSHVQENHIMPLLNGILPLFKAQLCLNIFKTIIKHCLY